MEIIDGRTYRTAHGEEHTIYRNPNPDCSPCAYWLSDRDGGTPPTAWYSDGKYWRTGKSEYDLVEEVQRDPWTTPGTILRVKNTFTTENEVITATIVPMVAPPGYQQKDLSDFVNVVWNTRDHAMPDGVYKRSGFYLPSDVIEAAEEPVEIIEETIAEDEPDDMVEPGVWTSENDESNVDLPVSIPFPLESDDDLINVKIAFAETSQAVEYHGVKNTYTKGPMFCIHMPDNIVYKHPVSIIWRVTEDYGDSGR